MRWDVQLCARMFQIYFQFQTLAQQFVIFRSAQKTGKWCVGGHPIQRLSSCFHTSFQNIIYKYQHRSNNFCNYISRRRALACAALQTHVQVGADKQISPPWSRVTRAQILILNVRFSPKRTLDPYQPNGCFAPEADIRQRERPRAMPGVPKR